MPEPDETETLDCHRCGGAIAVRREEQPQLLSCPHCGQTFLLAPRNDAAATGADVDRIDHGDPTTATPADERDDLDGLRIRQVFQMRRSMYRTRRYWLVGAGLCIVAAGQIVWKFFSPVGWVAMSGVQVAVLAVAFLIGGIFCARQAWALGRAAGRSVLGEPEGTPDFSRLSDGSQHWRNLEAMGGEERGEAP